MLLNADAILVKRWCYIACCIIFLKWSNEKETSYWQIGWYHSHNWKIEVFLSSRGEDELSKGIFLHWFPFFFFQPDPNDDNIIITEVFIENVSAYQLYWIGALFVINGLLLIFGAFLAWETRNITMAALNDSKLIGEWVNPHVYPICERCVSRLTT